MKRKVLFAAISLITMVSAPAAETTVDYGFASKEGTYRWGTKRAETYDVAIRIDDPRLVGMTVTGVTIPAVTGSSITDYSVWMTTELKLSVSGGVRKNKPNICSQDVVPANGVIRVDFNEPYVITDEGLYVGYTLTVTKEDDAGNSPLVVCGETRPGGFYLRTSVYYTRWEDRSEFAKVVSPMTVQIKGDFSDDSLDIENIEFLNVEKGKDFKVAGVVRNTGANAISDFDYEYEIAGKKGTGHVSLDRPFRALYNEVRDVKFTIASVDELGDCDYKVVVTKVNGHANTDAYPAHEAVACGLPLVPLHRVLVEEYTGSWCGNCVRGIAGMDQLKKRHPVEFVPVVYHNSDYMHMKAEYPKTEDNKLPRCSVDRVVYTDPYFGEKPGEFGLDYIWCDRQSEFTPVQIDVVAAWDEVNPDLINVTATTFWAKDPEDTDASHYRIEYVVLENDMHGTGSRWVQQNWAHGQEMYRGLPGLEDFVDLPDEIKDFKYQDVAVLTSGLRGVEGSVEDVRQFAEGTHTYQFDVNDAISAYNTPIIQNRDNLRVAAMLLYIPDPEKTYGQIVNSAQSKEVWTAGVEGAVVAPEDEVVEIYSLEGVRLSAPAKGINIFRTSDGRSRKVLIK